MNPRVLFAIAAASLCGTLGAATDAPPLLGFELRTLCFTLPAASAEAIGLSGSTSDSSSPSILSPEAFGQLIAKLSKEKGFDLTSMPKIAVKSETLGVVEMVQEFRYPSEFAAADFSKANKRPAADHQIIEVLSPTSFHSRNVGFTTQYMPTLGPDGQIDLEVDTSAVSFDGWMAQSRGKMTEPVESGRPEGGFQLPVFSKIRSTSSLRLETDQTALLGGFPDISEFGKAPDANMGKTKPSNPSNLHFVAITATALYPKQSQGNLTVGAPVRLSTTLVSIPRSKVPKGFLTRSSKKKGAMGTRILDSSVAEQLQSQWKLPQVGAIIINGPEKRLAPTERYTANATGTVPGESISLQIAATAKVESDSLIGLQVDAELSRVKENTAIPAKTAIEWSSAPTAGPAKALTPAKTSVALGNGQTLMLVNEDSSNPANVLLLLVKASSQ